MRELLAFLGLGVPMKYVDQFGMEGVVVWMSPAETCVFNVRGNVRFAVEKLYNRVVLSATFQFQMTRFIVG